MKVTESPAGFPQSPGFPEAKELQFGAVLWLHGTVFGNNLSVSLKFPVVLSCCRAGSDMGDSLNFA